MLKRLIYFHSRIREIIPRDYETYVRSQHSVKSHTFISASFCYISADLNQLSDLFLADSVPYRVS